MKYGIIAIAAIALLGVVTLFLRSGGVEESILIPGIGTFHCERGENDKKIYCYKCPGTIDRHTFDYVIYPKADQSNYTKADKAAVVRRIDQLKATIPSLLGKCQPKIRELCKKYEIKTNQFSDDELANQVAINLVKLDPTGTVEMYCSSGKIDDSFELVIDLDQQMQVAKVYFDG